MKQRDERRAFHLAPRLARGAGEARVNEDGAAMPTLVGHFAVFNRFAEIDSWEGRFLERIAPGAFRRTFAEDRDAIRVLYAHGHDFTTGDKPLGPILTLREDAVGAFYEVPLLDAGYVRELVPALEAGLLGASFRFRVTEEHVEKRPPRSELNPDGLSERTILQARVFEFGPCTFPAYADATAGVRTRNEGRAPLGKGRTSDRAQPLRGG